jgi:hypothetical protein
MDRDARLQDRVYPALLVLGALVAYLAFACPYVLGGDCAEYLALAARGGVAHPPGYPLQTLVLRALTPLAGGPMALAAARVTAVVSAGAVGTLYAACRCYRASPGAAVVACAVYALSPLAWVNATHVEVFALAALLGAALMALSGPACRVRGAHRLGALALVTGLGLSHHHTVLTLAPIGLVGGVRALRECPGIAKGAGVARALGLAAGGLAVGLLPYAYLVWVSHHPEGRWVWGDPMGARELVRHFTRADYWQAQASDHRVPMPSLHFAALRDSMVRGLLGVGVPLAGLGIAAAAVRGARRGGERMAALDAVAFACSAALAGPVLLAMLVGKPVGIYALVIERFHLLPQMIAAVPIAWGLDVGLSRLPTRARWAPWFATAALLAAVTVANGLTVPARLREDDRPTVEHYLRNTLAEVPADAVLVGTGDHRAFGFFFLQTIEGVRPDVTYVEASLLPAPWYRERIARALRQPEVPERGASLVATLVQQGRPVFVTDSLETVLPPGYPTVALGTVVRVLPPGASPPDADTLEAENLALARSFVREPHAPADPWSWSGEVDATYGRPFTDLSGTFGALGQPERARQNVERSARHGRLSP